MAEKWEKAITCPVLPDQQSKIPKYAVYSDMKTRIAPHSQTGGVATVQPKTYIFNY